MQLLDQYRILHSRGHFKGTSALAHADTIGRLIRMHGARTLLDYGCGKGLQYDDWGIHEDWGVTPARYDPAVDAFAKKPDGTFDGVICTDVLEHIPEDKIPETLAEIGKYADKFVFLTICTREARKTLPDGRNCHLTVRPKEWWEARLDLGVPVYVEFT